MLVCHHFQSVASLLNLLPDTVVIRVESWLLLDHITSNTMLVKTYKVKGSDFDRLAVCCIVVLAVPA